MNNWIGYIIDHDYRSKQWRYSEVIVKAWIELLSHNIKKMYDIQMQTKGLKNLKNCKIQ